jgi:methylated-DNA-protein-cysteine methyltransferase-like protein
MLADLLLTVRKIPRGKVATYGQVAAAAGFPGAARQVAWALHSGSGTGVPWQRVVGSGGLIKLGGDLAMEQRFRLEMEGVRFHGQRIDMKTHEFKFPRKAQRKKRSR